jgi:hypothetical protein
VRFRPGEMWRRPLVGLWPATCTCLTHESPAKITSQSLNSAIPRHRLQPAADEIFPVRARLIRKHARNGFSVFIDHQSFVAPLVGKNDSILYRELQIFWRSFLRVLPPEVVDDDPPHHAGRQIEKMASILPVHRSGHR